MNNFAKTLNFLKEENLNEKLDTVMKVSAKKASEMIKNMYPNAKARRATDEETEYVVGKEIVATYNVLDGKLYYKFKK